MSVSRIAGLGLLFCGLALGCFAEPSFADNPYTEYQRRLAAARRERARYVYDPGIVARSAAVRPTRVVPVPVPAYGPGYYPYYGRGVVGYAPQVTWFPTGATLNARATVSPDGRYVRVNAQPFFSSVPAVHTYNLRTGRTVRIR